MLMPFHRYLGRPFGQRLERVGDVGSWRVPSGKGAARRSSTPSSSAEKRRSYHNLKLQLLVFAKRVGMFRLARLATRRSVRILCYHGVWLGDPSFKGDAMFMSGTTFEDRLDTIQRLKYRVVPLSNLVQALREQGTVPSDSVVITIDDGWYSTLHSMVPALRRRGMPATLYCDTQNLESGQAVPHVMMHYFRLMHEDARSREKGRAVHAVTKDRTLPNETRLRAARNFGSEVGADVARYERDRVFSYMNAEELNLVSRAGIDVQLHSHTHSLHDFSPDAIAEELMRNRQALARVLDRDPSSFQHFCYPSGLYRQDSAEVLDQHDVLSSTTTVSGVANQGSELHFLPRLLDGENLSPIEFEAELCGFMAMARKCVHVARLKSLRSTGKASVRP